MRLDNGILKEAEEECPLMECIGFSRTIKDGAMNHGGIGKFASARPIVFSTLEETLKYFYHTSLLRL